MEIFYVIVSLVAVILSKEQNRRLLWEDASKKRGDGHFGLCGDERE